MFNEIINEIDDKAIKVRKIVDNFTAFEAELGKEKCLRGMSQLLTEIDYKILALIKELKIPSTDFTKRRQEGNWDI